MLHKTKEEVTPEWYKDIMKNVGGIWFAGYSQVILFFILSGFVLPLGFFINKRTQSITGGIFRRYLRLMLPVLLELSVMYLVARLGWQSNKTFNDPNYD